MDPFSVGMNIPLRHLVGELRGLSMDGINYLFIYLFTALLPKGKTSFKYYNKQQKPNHHQHKGEEGEAKSSKVPEVSVFQTPGIMTV